LLKASPAVFEILCSKRIGGHEFDFSGSREIVGYVTIKIPIGHFLLVVLWNQASVANGECDAMVDMT